MPCTFTFHIGQFTVTIIVKQTHKSKNRHSAK